MSQHIVMLAENKMVATVSVQRKLRQEEQGKRGIKFLKLAFLQKYPATCGACDTGLILTIKFSTRELLFGKKYSLLETLK